MSDPYYFQVRINPGMGGYWEAEITSGEEVEIIRSYKLDNLMAAIIERLMQYTRDYA